MGVFLLFQYTAPPFIAHHSTMTFRNMSLSSEGHLNEAGSKIPGDNVTQSEAKQKNREQEPESLAHRLPNALVIGVRKCGTNALINYLNLHPDIVASTEEIHYFDENYKRGLEWYKQQMPLSKFHQVRIESSPKYFHDGKVAKLIKAFNNSIALFWLYVILQSALYQITHKESTTDSKTGNIHFNRWHSRQERTNQNK